jgi:trans-aconitate methyltransferase
MDSEKHTRLSNADVRDYYDSQVASLCGSYTDERWHSSPIRESEYRQTARALRKALGKHRYRKMLEIGPGDGVWTPLLCEHVAGCAHLVEQSEEMIRRARQRLSSFLDVTYEHSDFVTSQPPAENDLIVAIRSFEYFQSKKAALCKMRDLLAPGGHIVIVTKNAELLTWQPVQQDAAGTASYLASRWRNCPGSRTNDCESYPAVLRLKAIILSCGLF